MMNKTCWRSKDELISDVLLWTLHMDIAMLVDQQEFIIHLEILNWKEKFFV